VQDVVYRSHVLGRRCMHDGEHTKSREPGHGSVVLFARCGGIQDHEQTMDMLLDKTAVLH
jgi:hypothetical protein